MNRFALLLVAAMLPVAAPAQTESSRQLFTQVEPILEGLSDITGWPIRRKVQGDYISKAKLNQFIHQRIREEVDPEDIRIESLALKMFGFLPDDYDLKQAIVDLMTEQAAAFYDYDKRRLFVTESDTSFMEKRAALIHELAHALADQTFPLGRYLRKGPKNDDAATAREAVVEGQATWLMWAYVAKLGGGEAEVSDFILESMQGASTAAVGAQFPVFEKAPLYLRESLIFPYAAGLRFQNVIYKKLGKAAFSEPFRRPPASTQQVIHPEQFLAGREPTAPKLPSIPEPKRYRTLSEGAVGELDFHILLEQYIDKETADRIAPHWRGGRFGIYETRGERKPLLTFVVEWDDPAYAREFFNDYRKILRGKGRSVQFVKESESQYQGTSERGGFRVTLEGAVLTAIEGTPRD